MASNLPQLCLDEIFVNLAADTVSLFSCLKVNRHWCRAAVKTLWRDPLSLKSRRKLSYPLALCLDDEDKRQQSEKLLYKQPLFRYLAFIKTLDLPLLVSATIGADFGDLNFNKAEANLPLVKAILHKKVTGDDHGVLTTLNLDFMVSTVKEQRFLNRRFSIKASNFTADDSYILFNLPNAWISLSNLRSLTVCDKNSFQILCLASQISPNISELYISLYVENEILNNKELCGISSLLPLLQSWPQLSILSFAEGVNRPWDHTMMIADDFLIGLAKFLPPNTFEHLILDAKFSFTASALAKFYETIEAKIRRISLQKAHRLQDEHLEIFCIHAEKGLIELDISSSKCISEEALSEALIFIPVIHLNLEEPTTDYDSDPNYDTEWQDQYNDFEETYGPLDFLDLL
ncbi:hypothetical protein G9A89_008329 [Geosiphon pyriformis]|nr:hypothetical protein G9A89_008329 [Geosiphon pyriformis]